MLNPASRYTPAAPVISTAPVESTTSMVITNHDKADELQQPQAYMEEPQEIYYPEPVSEAPEPKFTTHYAQDHFTSMSGIGIKESTMKKAFGLAAAAGGLFYLNRRLENAEAEKAKELLIEKIKSGSTHSSPANTTNTLLGWLVGIAGIGAVSHLGFESVKLAKMADHHRIIQNGLQP